MTCASLTNISQWQLLLDTDIKQGTMFASIALLALSLLFKESLQSCSSTAALTTCTWDTFKSSKTPQLATYKPYLTVSKGNLDSIPHGAFKFFPEVTSLQLSGNKINSLEENALEGLDNLKQLNLYDNQLTAVKQNSLKHCKNLERLDLGMNRISSIHEKAFDNVEKLASLNLAFNLLQTVPLALNSLENLETLRLDNNEISIVKAKAFSGLNKLKELLLNDNKLTKIEQNAFQGLTKLARLDLRVNFLSVLNVDDIVDDARNLNEVGISVNDFKCETLGLILDDFKRANVQVKKGVSKSRNSINGISCKT